MPGDRHAGFGERPGETGREQSRHRAPGRLNRWGWTIALNADGTTTATSPDGRKAAQPQTTRSRLTRGRTVRYARVRAGVAGQAGRSRRSGG